MSRFTAINLAELPFPGVVETLDFEQVLADMKDDLQSRDPEIFTELVLESSTVTKQLEVFAEREINLRARINDAAKSVMLAYSTGTDLENLHPVWVRRQVIQPADETANPPVSAVMEKDDSLRHRKQLAMEGFSSAGPEGAYQYFARAADAQVKDISVFGPELEVQDGELVSVNSVQPGVVKIVVLSRQGNGTADSDLQNIVSTELNREDVRPLTDLVAVESAQINEYIIDADLELFSGPDQELVRIAALEAVQVYADSQHRIGAAITLSGLYAALHQPGVRNVIINNPANGVAAADSAAPYCTDISVAVGAG